MDNAAAEPSAFSGTANVFQFSSSESSSSNAQPSQFSFTEHGGTRATENANVASGNRREMCDLTGVEKPPLNPLVESEAPKEPRKCKAKESDYIKIDPLPSVINLRQWRSHVRKVVQAASAYPKEALQWILVVEKAETW